MKVQLNGLAYAYLLSGKNEDHHTKNEKPVLTKRVT